MNGHREGMAFQEEGTVSAKAPRNTMDAHVTKEGCAQEVVMKFGDWRPGSGARRSFSVWVHFQPHRERARAHLCFRHSLWCMCEERILEEKAWKGRDLLGPLQWFQKGVGSLV